MDKYAKIVYQTDPIGEDKIILYLTTFDKEAFEKDQLLEQRYSVAFDIEKRDLQDNNAIAYLEKSLNAYVKKFYEPKIEELQGLIKAQRAIKQSIPLTNAKNITNSDDVHCGVVYGNITNCDNVYCTEIKGNVVNCDKIIYK